MTVEEFLAKARAREPDIRRSVDLWARQHETRPMRKRAFVVDEKEIAPDGLPYRMPYKMVKPRGPQ